MLYQGTIIEESLQDNRLINDFKILHSRVSRDENPALRWHLYKVEATRGQLETLATELKPEKWYAHFWNGDDVIAVFPNKTFEFKHSDRSTWGEAVAYGLSLSIPEEQLDFVIE